MESIVSFTGTEDESWFFVISNAMEARAKEVDEAERIERQAGDALVWLQDVQGRTGEVRADVCAVGDL